jgi:hypothetical protein
MRLCCLPLMLAATAATCPAQPAPDGRQNWFDDPFFQISSALPDCPTPLGPFITEAERRAQAHHRAEKGTTCWLAGQCDRPNFYAYDAEIAAALRAALAQRGPLPGSTLWVTVQGRVVYIEGCAADGAGVAELEALAKNLPHVQQTIAAVRTAASQQPPYPHCWSACRK